MWFQKTIKYIFEKTMNFQTEKWISKTNDGLQVKLISFEIKIKRAYTTLINDQFANQDFLKNIYNYNNSNSTSI